MTGQSSFWAKALPRRAISKWQDAAAKRLFWKDHLADAIERVNLLKRELTTSEMLLAAPLLYQGTGYYRSMGLKQNLAELLGLSRLVGEMKPRRVCEIGTFRGGTLFVWCQLAAHDAKIFSIDLPGGQFGGGYDQRSVPFFRSFALPGQRMSFLAGSSHDETIRREFEAELDNEFLDFLFIDGDHTYEGVKQDFEFYSRRVRPGGLIAFHDILKREDFPDIGVHRFWNELKRDYEHREFVDESNGRRPIGIGVVFQREGVE